MSARAAGRVARPRLWTRDFSLTVAGTFGFFASFFLLLSVVPDYVDEIGGAEWQVGLVFAGFSVLPLLVWPWVGLLSDRGRRKALMYGSIAIFTGAMALMALSQDVWSLFALRMLQGLGMAAFPTAGASLIGVVSPLSRRGEGVGYYGFATSGAQMIFPALGVLIVEVASFEVAFLVAAATAALTLIVVLPIREPVIGAADPAVASALRDAGGHAAQERPGPTLIPRAALFPMAVFFAVTLSFSAAAAFLPLLGDDRDLGNVGLFFLAGGAMSLVARPIAGPVSDRWGRTSVIVPGLLVMAVGMMVLAQADGRTMLVVAGLINGMGFGTAHTGLFALAFDRVGPTQRGGATAVFRSAWDSGGLIGGVGLGALATALDVETAFWVAAAVLVAAAAGYEWGRRMGWTRPYREGRA